MIEAPLLVTIDLERLWRAFPDRRRLDQRRAQNVVMNALRWGEDQGGQHRMTAEGLLHSLWTHGLLERFDGPTRGAVEWQKVAKLPATSAPDLSPKVHVLDADGVEHLLPQGPEADAFAEEVRAELKRRRIEQKRKELAEVGVVLGSITTTEGSTNP